MSIASSIGSAVPFAAGETLGPQFKDLPLAVGDLTKGVKGLTPALTDVTSAAKGFAAAANPSGLKPLSQAFDLMGATVGRMLAPGLFLLASEVIALAEDFDDMMPSAEQISDWYDKHIGDLEAFGDALKSATGWLVHFITTGETTTKPPDGFDSNTRLSDFTGPLGWLAGLGDQWEQADREWELDQKIKRRGHVRNEVGPGDLNQGLPFNLDFGGMAGGAVFQAAGVAGSVPNEDDPDFVGPRQAPEDRKANDRQQHRQRRADAFHDLVKQAQLDMGGQTGFGSIADAWKKAQQASFISPMEARMLQKWQKTIDALNILGVKIDKWAQGHAPNPVAPRAGAGK